jgi:hypothetical protein
MPFKSEKQRRFLWKRHPEIAKDWTNKYGSKVAKKRGGKITYASRTKDAIK